MKLLITFAFAYLIVLSARGQIHGFKDTDSLKNQLSTTNQDTSRVLILADLGEAYRSSNPDSALLYGRQALILARQINFPKGEIYALLSISVVQRELGNLAYALELALEALKIAQANKLEFEEANSLVRIANVYNVAQNFPEALIYYKQAEKKIKNKSLEWNLAITQSLIGDVYEQMNQLDSALYYEQVVHEKMFRIKGENLHQNVFRVLGNIYAKKGNNQLALSYYKQGIQAALQNREYRSASTINTNIASFYKKLNQPDSAIYYAKQGFNYGQKLAYKNRIMAASSLLAELYEPTDVKEALKYHKIASAAKDSLFSTQKVYAMQTLTFEEQERQREIEAVNTAYRNKIKQNTLLAALVVFLIIAIILYRNIQLKQKANKLLKRQKEEIDTQKSMLQQALDHLKATQAQLIQSEKMASLGELTAGIAHEIQNPLNFVNNFSEVSIELLDDMQKELANGDTEDALTLAADVKENLQKVTLHGRRADAIVQNMLQHSRASSGQKQLTNINALAEEYLLLTYHGLKAKDKEFTANLITDFDTNLGKVEVVPQELGRVLLNLFNNAFYATQQKKTQLNGQYQPEIKVSTCHQNGKAVIKVHDNGIGIPESVKDKIFQPFFTTKPTGQGTGLGLSLSYDIITKGHSGEIKVISHEGEYSEFIVQLPVK